VPSTPITTGLTWPAAHRLTEYLRIGGFALAVLLVELLLARGAAGPQLSRFVLLFVGAIATAFVFRFPIATALVFLALSDFIFYPTFFAVTVGPLDVRPHEAALGVLLLIAIVRPQQRTWGGTAGAALAVFFALVGASSALAITSNAAPVTDVFNWARPLGLLAFFYVIVRLFPSPEQRRTLLTGTAVLAAATGIVALAVSLGAGFGASLQESGGNAVRAQEGLGSIQRVRLAGLSAGYALFWYTVVRVVAARGERRLAWAGLLAGILLDIVVSFNRNMWLGLAVGLVLIAIFGGVMVRRRLFTAIAIAMAGVALFVAFGSSTTSSSVVAPVVHRGATIFNPNEVSKEGSFNARARETRIAWRTARQNLLLGVGVGVPFGVIDTEQIGPHSFEQTPQLFLHNQYLYLLLIGGVPGLLAFLVFLGAPLAHALRRVPRDPAISACGVGIAMIMISSVVAIYFTVEDMTAILGLLTGVLVADAEGRAAAKEPSGLMV
jgi:O-antigen ligase